MDKQRVGLLGVLCTAGLVTLAAACSSTAAEQPADFEDGFARSAGDSGAGATRFGEGGVGSADTKACTSNGDCGSGECNPATRTCACGGQSVAATRVQANLLVVLDRSCSMTDAIPSGGTKWAASVAALSQLMTKYEADIRFGLTLFPDKAGDNCSQGTIPFPVGSAAQTMRARLTQTLNQGDPLFPNGPCVTNIDTGMLQAKTDPSLFDKSRPSFVVLVTDGIQSPDCSSGGANLGTLKAVKDLALAGVGTFVVGFGAGVDSSFLDSVALAGGHARLGAPHLYFDASDQASLDAALLAIGGSTLSCELKLATPPPGANADDIYVFFDGKPTPVPRDPARKNGWDYDGTTQSVRFFGAPCDLLKSGAVQKESVVLGCGAGVAPAPR